MKTYEVKDVTKRVMEMKKEGYKVIASAGCFGATLKRGKKVVTLISK